MTTQRFLTMFLCCVSFFCCSKSAFGAQQPRQATTEAADPAMYAWEQDRNGILSFSDLVLCYGGSTHRTPYRWDEQRFAPFVAYTDKQGKEHWLFDSFLFIEFQDSSRPDGGYYAYMVGLMKDYGFSAGKTQWKELIDYWFAGGSGMDALEGAVKDASARLGVPPSKRKVIMVLPDPIIYKVYDGKGNGKGDPGSTVYWGELNGRKMDFSTAEDRIAAQNRHEIAAVAHDGELVCGFVENVDIDINARHGTGVDIAECETQECARGSRFFLLCGESSFRSFGLFRFGGRGGLFTVQRAALQQDRAGLSILIFQFKKRLKISHSFFPSFLSAYRRGRCSFDGFHTIYTQFNYT